MHLLFTYAGLFTVGNAYSVFFGLPCFIRAQCTTPAEGVEIYMLECHTKLMQSNFQATALMLGHAYLVGPPAGGTNVVSEIPAWLGFETHQVCLFFDE